MQFYVYTSSHGCFSTAFVTPFSELSTMKYASSCTYIAVFGANLFLNSLTSITLFTIFLDAFNFCRKFLSSCRLRSLFHGRGNMPVTF